MRKRTNRLRSVSVGVVAVLLLVSAIPVFQPAFALSNPGAEYQDVDLSNAILQLEDLPSGFEPSGEFVLGLIDATLPLYQLQLFQTDELVASPVYGADEIVNLSGFRAQDDLRQDVIYSWLVTPLSRSDQSKFDRAFEDAGDFILRIQDVFDDEQAHLLSGYENIGDTRLAYTYKFESFQEILWWEHVVIRRGPVLIEIEYHYRDGDQPLLNTVELARILDDRVVEVVGRESATTFRPAGPLVPEITTHIPTPLDVSTQPGVIGTNLLLAALLMLPFAAAAEIFTRILGEHEEALRRRIRLVDWVARMQKKVEAATGASLKRPGLQDAVKVMGVIFFYGIVFSLLDRTWNPFSLKGLVLLGSMMFAYGVVGVADDLFQWRVIRRWGLQAEFTVRPTNFLLAAFSTTASRLFTLVPGMMFGTPEALQTDEDQFDDSKRRTLLKISAITLTVVGVSVWIPTVLTEILQRLNLAEAIKNLIGGVEAFLLVVFAVALENLFVQMLGMPDSLGHALKQRSRWGWLVGLGMVAFLFYHTLINPRGELAAAIQEANVLVFFGIAIAFMLVAFGLQLYLGQPKGARPTVNAPATPRIKTGLALESRHRSLEPTASVPTQSTAIPQVDEVLIVVPIAECKQCPVCGEMIKSEARLCRFCRATFAVSVKGYCTECHQVVDVNEDGKCVLCSKEPNDIHVESRLLKVPAAMPARVLANEPARANAPDTEGDGNLKQCPVCGQTIKAEALICRFCRAHFEVHTRGYCLADHAVVDVRDGKCVKCGDEARDVHFESILVGETALSVPPASPSRAPAIAIPFAAEPVTAAAAPVIAARTPFWKLYLSPHGRVGRLTFFLKGILPVLGLLGLILFISMKVIDPVNTSELSGATAALMLIGMIILMVGMSLLYWALLVLIIKRFHDLGRSGWNVLLWLIPLAGQFINLWNWIEFLFVKGTAGPNKFGDRPD